MKNLLTIVTWVTKTFIVGYFFDNKDNLEINSDTKNFFWKHSVRVLYLDESYIYIIVNYYDSFFKVLL